MRKTDKKLKNQIIEVLTEACTALQCRCVFNQIHLENDFGFDNFTNINKAVLNTSKEYISIKSTLEKQLRLIFKDFKASEFNVELQIKK